VILSMIPLRDSRGEFFSSEVVERSNGFYRYPLS